MAGFKVRYLALQHDGSDRYWITLRPSERVALGPDLADEFTFKQIDDARTGSGIALVAWSGKKPDGSPFLADRYVPETVATVDDLLDRAKLLACRDHLEPMLLLLQKRFRESRMRETLGSLPHSSDRPRIVEACLLGSGDAGLMTAEGASANPSTTDLICEAYLAIHRRPDLADRIFGSEASEVAVGQGFSALTMPLRDSKLLLFAAAFAERFHRLQREGLPKSDGMLLLGGVGPDGISQSWTETTIGPRLVSKGAGCEIRISPDVDRVICEEVAQRPGSEAGGILFGRYCDVTGHFHVVGTLPAPPDSKFSAEEFVLGTKGLKPMLRGLIEGTGGALYPLGTWHNHLIPSDPSAKDMRTAALLSGLQYFPLLMLILAPSGYSHLTVETISDAGDLLQFKAEARA